MLNFSSNKKSLPLFTLHRQCLVLSQGVWLGVNLHVNQINKNEIPWNKFKVFRFNCFRKFNRTFWLFSFLVTKTFFQFWKKIQMPPQLPTLFQTSSVLFFFYKYITLSKHPWHIITSHLSHLHAANLRKHSLHIFSKK